MRSRSTAGSARPAFCPAATSRSSDCCRRPERQLLIPALTSYETDWTGIGGRLGDAVILELAHAAGKRKPEDASSRQTVKPVTRLKMPVEFKPGESACRV
jgi:hypothetical protein